MIRKLLAAAAALAVAAAPQAAFAWGGHGHRIIGQAAIRALPEEIPAWLRSPESATLVGELSREPDRWKGGGRIHDHERNAAHFIDLDDQGRALGGPALNALPETLEAYRTAVRAAGRLESDAGYLPYAIVDAWQQLRLDMAYWRVLVAAENRATDPGRRAWYAQDRRLREALLLRDLGVLSHYVADGSQPMHLSIHYNGWGNYPNPEGFTTARNTHSVFEGDFVRANVTLEALEAAMSRPSLTPQPIEQRVPVYLRRHWEQIVPFFRLERAGGFTTDVARGRTYATAQMAAGASELRDLVVLAWRASADAEVGWRPVKVRDVEAGTADPFNSLYAVD